MKVIRFITYTDFKFFKNYKKVSLDSFLKKVPKLLLLEITSELGYKLLYREGNFDIHNETLRKFFFTQERYLKKVCDVINRIQESDGAYTIIFTPIANLKIQEYAILNGVEKKISKPRKKDLLNVFKSYLLINEMYNEKMNMVLEKIESRNRNEKLFFSYVCIFFNQLEFTNTTIIDVYAQLFKSIFLFKFLEKSKLSSILPLFLKANGFLSWQQYIRTVSSIIIKHTNLNKYVDTQNAQYIISFDEKFINEIAFMDNVSINNKDLLEFTTNSDFKSLRNFPIYKVNQNTFVFLSLKLFQDKLFTALLFDLHKIFKENTEKISLPDFKTKFYSKPFIEEYLLRYLLKNCFENKFSIYKSENKKGFECSDYYMTDGFNNLFLIECKDILINAEIKNSFDPEAILEYIQNRLVKDAGINQIINVIKKIDAGKSKEEPIEKIKKNFKKIIIYPMIVYTDKTMDCNGLNQNLNDIFLTKINEAKFENVEVKSLILININIFVIYFELFKKKSFDFTIYLKAYIKYLKKDDYFFADFNSIFAREIGKLDEKVKIKHSPILGEFWKNNDIKIDL